MRLLQIHERSVVVAALVLFAINFLTVAAEKEPFRINKLNLIWSKAQHSLGSTKLKDLSADLAKHELDEITLKKMKAHNQDKEGVFELSVRRRLISILKKYSLERYTDDIYPKSKTTDSEKAYDDSELNHRLKPTFRDKKLDKLWKKAEQLGFSDEQLMLLKEEFHHHQSKLDEHYDVMNSLNQDNHARKSEQEKALNSIDVNHGSREDVPMESPSEKKLRLEKNIHQALGDKYKAVKQGIDDLHKKIIDGKIGPADGPFEEETVNSLWATALNSSLSKEDLELFKSELEDFEIRVKKLKHFTNQLERSQLEPGSDSETKHLQKRVAELTSKVDKTLKTLVKKFEIERDEL